MFPLEPVLAALGFVFDYVSDFCHLSSLMDMIRKSDVECTVVCVTGMVSRTLVTALCS